MHGTLMYLNFSQQLSLFFFFLFFLSLPSKTPRPLPSKKASGLSQLAVEVQGSLFLPLCQHNHFFSAGTMKNNKNNSGWKKSDIWHLPRMAKLSPEDKKPSAFKKRLRPHLSLPLSTVMCPARPGGDSSGGARGERARGNAVECAGEEKGGSEPSKWLWKGPSPPLLLLSVDTWSCLLSEVPESTVCC